MQTIIFYYWKNSKVPKVPSSGQNQGSKPWTWTRTSSRDKKLQETSLKTKESLGKKSSRTKKTLGKPSSKTKKPLGKHIRKRKTNIRKTCSTHQWRWFSTMVIMACWTIFWSALSWPGISFSYFLPEGEEENVIFCLLADSLASPGQLGFFWGADFLPLPFLRFKIFLFRKHKTANDSIFGKGNQAANTK